jgi:hypothetical protein
MLTAILGGWRQILTLLVIGAVVFVWARFQLQEQALDRAEAALAGERQMRAAAEARLALSEAASDEAERTHSVNTITHTIEGEISRDLTDALQRQDAHALYATWVSGVIRLRDAERELSA